ncbi:hypothetical protein UXO16_24035 [Enterobacter hormaechei]|uniref:hypothetical protein n=3 Tax=Enterobacter hormaechei TaxID=158836 RepID=UPI001E2BCC07|nr:hypothetical protein [Enterobacter hormaechei]HBE9214554.1 hypothetical protein [Escherichia coli]HEG1830004.1 hypothetical protein [Enterobacter cloacae]MCC4522889.1 hypothetical protein [Enterobacter hormaechei]MCC4553759.1 hypothetical protein [Enterobacter hormaechei]MCE1521687.1 hypothetical protein [Enterobacter hormaechei]
MIGKLLKKYKKSIITPTIASGVLLIFSVLEMPKTYNYTSAYIAEILVALTLYVIALISVRYSKVALEKKEEKYTSDISDSLLKANELMLIIGDKNEEGSACLVQHINHLLKEKTSAEERRLKKQKDEMDSAQEKYEAAIKEREKSQSELEKSIDDTIKETGKK